jgi:hypothetical protein
MGGRAMNPAILYAEDQSAFPYPRNAGPIVAARAKGMKPAGPVMVVLTDKYRLLPDDAHVFADMTRRYRWDWVAGLLSVVIVIDASTKFGDLPNEIQVNSPRELDIVDCERRKGWKVCLTYPQLRTTKWLPHEVDSWLGLETTQCR